MKFARTCALVALSFCLTNYSLAQLRTEKDILDKDFEHFLSALNGEWGNMDQYFFQSRLGVAKEEHLPLLHYTYVPTDLMGEDANATYAKLEILKGDEATLVERVLIHSRDYDTGEIVTRQYAINSSDEPLDFHLVNAEARKLGQDEWSADVVECEIRWHRQGDQIVGRPNGGICAEPALLNIDEGDLFERWALSAYDFWIPLAAQTDTSEAQSYVFAAKMRRANVFNCRINIVLADAEKVEWGGLIVKEFDTWTDLRVHDQGGEAWVTTNDDPPRRLGFRLHNVVWPFGESGHSRGIFLLDASKPDDGRGIAYASSSPNSERIALSNRDASVTCYRIAS